MGFACDIDEYPDVFNVTHPVARVEHKCCECGHVIAPGEEYERAFTVFDGYAWTDKTCERCSDLRSSFHDLGYCTNSGDLLSDYQEWLVEHEGTDIDAAREKVAAIRQKHRDWSPSPKRTQEGE